MKAKVPLKKPSSKAKRKESLLSVAGIWKDRTDLPDTEVYLRSLRKGRLLAPDLTKKPPGSPWTASSPLAGRRD